MTSPTINALTFASGTSTSGLNIGANGIVFEGATVDAHETTLNAEDPTQDNTITIFKLNNDSNYNSNSCSTGSAYSESDCIRIDKYRYGR